MDFVGLRNQVSVLLNNPDEYPPGYHVVLEDGTVLTVRRNQVAVQT